MAAAQQLPRDQKSERRSASAEARSTPSPDRSASEPAPGSDPSRSAAARRAPTGRVWIGWLVVALAIGGGVAAWQLFGRGRRPPAGGAASSPRVGDSPVDGARSYTWLQRVCELGARPSGSPSMRRQQELLTEHFQGLGARVELQTFDVRHPLDGSAVTMGNLIAQWHPERPQRVLLCCHYDTRPFPDEDRSDPKGTFVGANDGGSGVAVLAELAHHMRDLPGPLGVDFVLFDGEEFLFRRDSDDYFRGSTHFAQQYRATPPAHRYVRGVLLDMVGDKELQLYFEKNSVQAPGGRELCQGIWKVAADLGVREFVPRVRHEVRDDHLPLIQIAGITTCDLIDFDYPRPGVLQQSYWHTTQDTPDKCSAASLGKVGAVLLEWLRRQRS